MSTIDDWYAQPVLTGNLVQLRPLAIEDAAGYLVAATDSDEERAVFRWLPIPAPVNQDEAHQQLAAALSARARGERFAYAQLNVSTGQFIGSTSFYEVDPARRALGIGHTWLTRRTWRGGFNTESKLLLLTRAFEGLEAARVVFHTDILNTRSQAAIERLGALKEGVIRKHRIRPDGSWRDSVQYSIIDDDWSTVRERLVQALERGAKLRENLGRARSVSELRRSVSDGVA